MLLKVKVVSWSLGTFFAVSFILCVLYGVVVPPRLHGMSRMCWSKGAGVEILICVFYLEKSARLKMMLRLQEE